MESPLGFPCLKFITANAAWRLGGNLLEKFGSAVILCGGKSTRMGFDKRNIKIDGRLLIDIIAEQLNEIFHEVILMTNNKKFMSSSNYMIKEDLKKDFGPAGGIYSGLKDARSQYVFFIAGDMPIINIEYIRYMMNILEHNEYDGVLSKRGKWIEPLYAFYSKSTTDNFLRNIEGNHLKLFDIIKQHKMFYVEENIVDGFNRGVDMFTNLNYAKDLSILYEIYGKGVNIGE